MDRTGKSRALAFTRSQQLEQMATIHKRLTAKV
jgi:hypothetical protein